MINRCEGKAAVHSWRQFIAALGIEVLIPHVGSPRQAAIGIDAHRSPFWSRGGCVLLSTFVCACAPITTAVSSAVGPAHVHRPLSGGMCGFDRFLFIEYEPPR
ncbi:MAG: hypothetical protein MR450_12655 [Prevotella sp.]|nr:hypothetical protein [Prevotella sp.]